MMDITWFQETYETVLIRSEDDIRNALSRGGVQEDLAYKLAELVNTTIISVSESALYEWKKNLYTYNNNIDGFVIFVNEGKYIDCYGNYYKNLKDCEQILCKLSRENSLQTMDGRIINVRFIDNDEICETFFRCFPLNNNSFRKFLDDCDKYGRAQIVSLLLDIKAVYNFFMKIDAVGKAFFGISMNEEISIRVIFKNWIYRDYPSEKIINDFNEIIYDLDEINLNGNERTRDYLILLNESSRIVLQNKKIDPDEINRYKKSLSELIMDSDYLHTCHYIAIELLEGILREYETIKLQWLKYLVWWVALQFEDETHAITTYVPNPEALQNNFSCVYDVVKKFIKEYVKKDRKHKFSNDFSAIYHFCKHYYDTRNSQHYDTLICAPQERVLPLFIEKNREALESCARFYLLQVPADLFDRPTPPVPTIQNGCEDYEYLFKDVKGIKYRLSLWNGTNTDIKTMYGLS